MALRVDLAGLVCPKCGRPCQLFYCEPDGCTYARHGLRIEDGRVMGLRLCRI